MNAAEIRSQFIRYFSGHGHQEVPSSPLVPSKDPTLLFTNAGMVQFKSIFLGEEKRSYSRAVSSQKCIRAGGKHNDLENVGQTARHHTFFEMLGNFSFGDYFKEDAIAYAWELLTVGYHLPPSALWVTVFHEDDEAAALWKKIVPSDRIIPLGHKDNFWQMGDVGPCGPCSEVMFDQGAAVHPDCPGIGRCDCDRYLEIWNLVFMQYSRGSDGKLVSLPKPSIDTGMGLERLTAVRQGVLSNYDTDLFKPLFHAIAKGANRSEDEIRASMPGRVIADHLRAITFLTSDGVVPSNEGRGYVLRRILRRAARFGKKLGFHDPFLCALTGDVITLMQEAYPELVQNHKRINRIVLGEEERFIHTLNQGVQLIEEIIQRSKKKGVTTLPGEELFTLYDTYGFPLDIAEEIADEAGMSLDQDGFHKAMEIQKERARRSWVGDGGQRGAEKKNPLYRQVLEESGETRFTGYDHLEEAVTLLAIFKDGELVHSARGGENVELMFNPSPFYAESGGQVGDRGTLASPSALVEIDQTTKPLPDLFLHHAKVVQGAIEVGGAYHAIVDRDSRRDTARNHTGTHLLHAVLREVLGDHVKQAGSLVTPDRLRFDFQHFSPLTDREIDRIEERVNERIREDVVVQTRVLDLKEAIATGAMALFGEKYGDQVRVVEVADFSRELCGGTHCRGTGEIGLFKMIRESSVAAGIRRIEAVTGLGAYRWVKDQERSLQNLATIFRSRPDEVLKKAERLLGQMQEKDREMERLRSQRIKHSPDPLSNVHKIGSLSVLSEKIPPANIREVRAHADHLRDLLKSGLVIVGAVAPDADKVTLVVMVTSDWTDRFSAAEIVKEIAGVIDGTGGGKREMAQAGGKNVEKLDMALERAIEIIKNIRV